MLYVPDRGDIIWIDFNPQRGHEQAKRRPGLVLSPKAYNQKTSLCLLCPMTSKQKGYPFEVLLKNGDPENVILSDQVKSLDWKARNAIFKSRASQNVLEEVIGKFLTLIE